jgi:hypothetical protein
MFTNNNRMKQCDDRDVSQGLLKAHEPQYLEIMQVNASPDSSGVPDTANAT